MFKRICSYILICLFLNGCDYVVDRSMTIGRAPTIKAVDDPRNKPDWRPVKADPDPIEETKPSANSLWQPGARDFFRDQRARRVGDILRVTVNINDTASLSNSTTAKRNASESLGVPNLFGVEKSITKKGHMDVNSLASLSNKHSTDGTGSTARTEAIQTVVAAIVTQILPNGNLVIQGTQEIRVNYDLREVTVAGIVRPEDITASNTITSDQIAEARISYGGKGQLDNLQQPRIGNQILDAFSPF